MNIKRWVLASLSVFLVFEILDSIVHMVFLSRAYQNPAIVTLWRADMMSLMWLMYVSTLVLSFVFVYIFSKGYEGKGVIEGVRFGLVFGVIMAFVAIVNQYVVYPIPLALAVQWFIYGMIEFVCVGIVAALVYKPKA